MPTAVRFLLCLAALTSPALAQAEEAPAAPAGSLRLYMRSDAQPLTFVARTRAGDGPLSWCVSPCNTQLTAGDYELELNGVTADDSLSLRQPGTLHGSYQSQASSRAGAWLALNVGGIIGGVFITVAVLGGPTWTYIAGGGTLAAAGVIFAVTYRVDTASVSFTPNEPSDVRKLPLPPATMGADAFEHDEHAAYRAEPRSLGFRLLF